MLHFTFSKNSSVRTIQISRTLPYLTQGLRLENYLLPGKHDKRIMKPGAKGKLLFSFLGLSSEFCGMKKRINHIALFISDTNEIDKY